MNNKQAAITVAIFGISAIVGFIYGRGVRENANSAVTTDYSRGKATVTLDVVKLASGGLG